ncbi:MAG: hypothetical protein GY835_26645 [bacterium]|nr:hypothetical protein [bacterium]
MRLLYLILPLTILISILPLSAQAHVEARVFIAASYDCDNLCGRPQEEGVIKGLAQNNWFEGVNLTVERFYMNTKKVNTTAELMAKAGQAALERIKAFRPNIVIVLDDNAFREIGLKLVNKPGMSVVFSGMNGQPETYNKRKRFMNTRGNPGGNVTGVYEKLYIENSLNVLTSAIPAINGKRVVGIIDNSPTADAIQAQIIEELRGKMIPVVWELQRTRNWDEYTSLIRTLNRDDSVGAIFPIALTLEVSAGVTYSASEIYRWTLEHSRKPELALNYYFSEFGLFGGVAVDFKGMGILAGKQAGRILNGEDVGTIPIEDAPDYAIVFNITRAQELGIEIPDQILTAADHIFK